MAEIGKRHCAGYRANGIGASNAACRTGNSAGSDTAGRYASGSNAATGHRARSGNAACVSGTRYTGTG